MLVDVLFILLISFSLLFIKFESHDRSQRTSQSDQQLKNNVSRNPGHDLVEMREVDHVQDHQVGNN